MAKKFIQASHSFGAEMNLKINFLVNVKVRIIRGFRRDVDTDNVGSKTPVDFGEKFRIEVQTVLFRRNMPKAIRVNFVAFRYGYLEENKKLKG